MIISDILKLKFRLSNHLFRSRCLFETRAKFLKKMQILGLKTILWFFLINSASIWDYLTWNESFDHISPLHKKWHEWGRKKFLNLNLCMRSLKNKVLGLVFLHSTSCLYLDQAQFFARLNFVCENLRCERFGCFKKYGKTLD